MDVTRPKKLTDFRWLNLFSVHWKNRNKEGEWVFASRKKEPANGPGPLKPDAVIVVPIHVNDQGQRRLVVLREFRIPLNDYEYAFPAGLCEADVVADASRELEEETGLRLTAIIKISPTLISSAGLSDESVVLVFCECEGTVNHDGNEATEEIEVHLLDYAGVCALCESRNKFSAKTWPVLFMYKSLGAI